VQRGHVAGVAEPGQVDPFQRGVVIRGKQGRGLEPGVAFAASLPECRSRVPNQRREVAILNNPVQFVRQFVEVRRPGFHRRHGVGELVQKDVTARCAVEQPHAEVGFVLAFHDPEFMRADHDPMPGKVRTGTASECLDMPKKSAFVGSTFRMVPPRCILAFVG